ncbi:MAG: hypothetical protein KAU90_05525 [Sulfurovaceae bacterium]|nr:hypothetical protein [Sulfurovaceae bacterium]
MKKILLAIIVMFSSLYATIIEDAEDGKIDGWKIVCNTKKAKIKNIYNKSINSRVIKLSGKGHHNIYMLGDIRGDDAWNNTTEHKIEWDMKFRKKFKISIAVKTKNGLRYLIYDDKKKNKGLIGNIIHHGLGKKSHNNKWQHFKRDLKLDIQEFEPDNELISTNAFIVRGKGLLDNIILSGKEKKFNLSLIGKDESLAVLWDVALSNDENKLFITKWMGFSLLDISNPATPSLIGTYNLGLNTDYLILSNDNSKLFIPDDNGLKIVDVSNPTQPTILGQYPAPATYRNRLALSADNTKVFMINKENGLLIIDVSDPSNPVLLGSYKTDGIAKDVKLSSDEKKAFVAYGTSGLQIIDITDLSNPSLINSYPTTTSINCVSISKDDKIAYLTVDSPVRADNLEIVDISDIYNPILLGTYSANSNFGIKLFDNDTKAFLLDGYSDISIINLKDPKNPSLLTKYNTDGDTLNVSISKDGNRAFVADGDRGLYIFNLFD